MEPSDRMFRGKLNALRRDLSTLERALEEQAFWRLVVAMLALAEVVRGIAATVSLFQWWPK